MINFHIYIHHYECGGAFSSSDLCAPLRTKWGVRGEALG